MHAVRLQPATPKPCRPAHDFGCARAITFQLLRVHRRVFAESRACLVRCSSDGSRCYLWAERIKPTREVVLRWQVLAGHGSRPKLNQSVDEFLPVSYEVVRI